MSENLSPEITRLALEYQDQMISWRRHLHQHPELGFQETNTAAYLSDLLGELGYQVQTGVAGTGVVGLLHGALGNGKVVALRADMDALPVQELAEAEYRSRNPGVMHACGHDSHMAFTLGAAAILANLKDKLHGSIKIILQPAEEGPGGAQPMIEEGVLQHPIVDYVLGGHAWPDLAVGKVELQGGPMMAASNSWKMKITGRGGHGAEPHRCSDAIAIAAQIIVTLQQIVSRTNDPQDPAVFTVGMFQAGTRANIIAETAELSGTMRTFNDANRSRIQRLIAEIAEGICKPFGATFELEFADGFGATINDDDLAARVVKSAQKILGEAMVSTRMKPSMAAEDFACFAQQVPSCYLRLGVNDGIRGIYPLHHNRFDIAEEALVTGAMVMAQAAVDLL
ncbi:MAG: M20 family metallopeptidase [Symbiobacteriaceae bacterium]|nr:M20 family metallopeptidase [Symbiobacteriaceae bacterium]